MIVTASAFYELVMMQRLPSISHIEQLFSCFIQETPDAAKLQHLLCKYRFTGETIKKALELCESNFTNCEEKRTCKNILHYELMVICGVAFKFDR